MTHTQPQNDQQSNNQAPINWVPAVVLISTPITAVFLVPWYLWTHEVSTIVWVMFAFFMAWTGLSITAGYHRLLAHRTYKANPVVKYFLVLGATFAVEGSAFDWCAGHRLHHRFVDDKVKDPYSAKRGFWFSHIGWMLRNHAATQYDYKNIPDLLKDPVLQLQNKYYGFWVLFTNVALVALLGWAIGDIWGTLVLVGLLRLVLTHHFTFFINSLCHMFGTRPYTDSNTARDNFFLAIFTWGEGYHNYHHFFQYDYRNGVKWWQYDPTKWFIFGLSKVYLTSGLRTVDAMTIKHAELKMQFKRAQRKIDRFEQLGNTINAEYQAFKERISKEYEAFNTTIEEWQALKTKAIDLKKNEFSERLNEVDEMLKGQYKQIEHKIFTHGKQLELAFKRLKQQTAS